MTTKKTKRSKPKAKTSGRPPVHPASDCKRTMVRSTVAEERAWKAAAARDEVMLGLSPGTLTVGPAARRVLNLWASGKLEGPEIADSWRLSLATAETTIERLTKERDDARELVPDQGALDAVGSAGAGVDDDLDRPNPYMADDAPTLLAGLGR